MPEFGFSESGDVTVGGVNLGGGKGFDWKKLPKIFYFYAGDPHGFMSATGEWIPTQADMIPMARAAGFETLVYTMNKIDPHNWIHHLPTFTEGGYGVGYRPGSYRGLVSRGGKKYDANREVGAAAELPSYKEGAAGIGETGGVQPMLAGFTGTTGLIVMGILAFILFSRR